MNRTGLGMLLCKLSGNPDLAEFQCQLAKTLSLFFKASSCISLYMQLIAKMLRKEGELITLYLYII